MCVHLDAVFGALLQVRYYGVVPQVNEPLPELCHGYWARQEEAGTCGKQNVVLTDFLFPVFCLNRPCVRCLSPMRKSEVLCFSRKVWRWYQS